MNTLYDNIQTAAEHLRGRLPHLPSVGVVLGSGLGAIAGRLANGRVFPYQHIPEFPHAGVPGHAGRLVVGELGGACVCVMQGRFHYYEGLDMVALTLPVRVLAALGVRTLVLTAAVGAINPSLNKHDIVCISDHINMLGVNPLRGVTDERLGPRFPDLSGLYGARLRQLARFEAERLGFKLNDAIYVAMPGPSYETPAEIRMLRALGADVVGMSTVPEAIVAKQAGIQVLALALVTNAAAGLSSTPITHTEVLEAGRVAETRIGQLIEAVIVRRLDESEAIEPQR